MGRPVRPEPELLNGTREGRGLPSRESSAPAVSSRATGPPDPPHVRRNFVLGLLHGWFLAGGLAFADPYTVLPVFVRHVTSASWVVGLAAPLLRGGGFLPQILTARYAETLHRQKPLLIAVMSVRFASWIGIAAATFFLAGSHPALALLLVLALLLLFSLAGGVGAVPFQEIFARLFPPTLRGRFLAFRQLGGGLLAILAGLIVKIVLDRPLPFASRYGLLFLLSALSMAVGFIALGAIAEEPLRPHKTVPEKLPRFLQRLQEILRRDHSFRRLLAAELFMRTIHLCLPFLVLDFRARFGLGIGFVGTALSASMAGQLFSNLWWGRLSDRHGNRFVILTVNALAVLLTGGALATPGPAAALAVFFLTGAVLSGSSIGYTNYLLELAPSAQRPAYISLRGTLTAPMLFLGVPGGVLVDRLGYGSVELLALLGTLGGLVAASRLPCLRSR